MTTTNNNNTRGPWWSYIALLSTKQYRLTMKINTKYTTKDQIFLIQGQITPDVTVRFDP